jgi:anti-sigma regulatory factor (Ser/Thr protein kinase)
MIANVQLPPGPTAPFAARRLVGRLARDLDPVQSSDALLAVTELVTNAFRHGRGPISLRVESRSGWLRAEVGDEGNSFRAHEVGGTGLGIVRAVSDEWGADSRPTLVWFEIGAGA